MKTKFLDAVKKYSMLSRGDSVAVGFSGGADSVCLLSILDEHKDILGISLRAIHINHGIRGHEADRDEEFCRQFCADRNIPISVFKVNIPEIAKNTGESTELCARRVRYEIFNESGADKIATAHSASDRIETFLFNLSRGSALNGLCSIPPVRENIVRPLIGITRSEIEKYCEDNGLSYVTDSTNLTDEYTRNKYRLNVIPELVKINPSFERNALRCIEILNDENAFADAVADREYERLIQPDGRLAACEHADISILRRVIVKYLDSSGASYENRHIAYICDNLTEKFSVVLPGNVQLNGDGAFITVIPPEKEARRPLEEISFNKEDGTTVFYNGKKIQIYLSDEKSDAVSFLADASKVGDRLYLRPRKPGDIMRTNKKRPLKQLKKIYNEMKISPQDREFLYVLCDEQGTIFAEGVGVDAGRLPEKDAEHFLIINLECGKND